MVTDVLADSYLDTDYLAPYSITGQFFAICGLSGSGKSTLLHKMADAYPKIITYVDRVTTRKWRSGDNLKEMTYVDDDTFIRNIDSYWLYRIKSDHKAGLPKAEFDSRARDYKFIGATFHVISTGNILDSLPETPVIFISSTVDECLKRTFRRENLTTEALAKKKAKLTSEKPQFDALIERHRSKPNTRVLQSPPDMDTPEYARFFDEAIGLLRSTGRLLP